MMAVAFSLIAFAVILPYGFMCYHLGRKNGEYLNNKRWMSLLRAKALIKRHEDYERQWLWSDNGMEVDIND